MDNEEYYLDKQFDMAKVALEKVLALEEYNPGGLLNYEKKAAVAYKSLNK